MAIISFDLFLALVLLKKHKSLKNLEMFQLYTASTNKFKDLYKNS
jgi:hypothetical protein